MNHEKKSKGLAPKLRFPEFRDKGKWDNELFETLFSFKVTNCLSRENLNYRNGTVKNVHYGDIHTKFATLFDIKKELVPFINSDVPIRNIREESYCIEGDIIFADASEDMEDVGKSIEIINLGNEKLLSGLHTLLARQKTERFIIGFCGYLFKSGIIRRQIQKESQGAKVLGISAGRLANIRLFFPSKQEQKKIADCLTSLDELITAEATKLKVYKAHKKGLMQKLFPAEGETVPEWRFPEFLGKGKWIKQELGDMTTNVSKKNKEGLKLPIYSINNNMGFIPQNEQFVGVDSNNRGYDINLYKIVDKHTFAYNPARINVGSIGYSGELHNIIISSLYVCFKTKKELDDQFLQVFLKTSNFLQSVNDNVEGGIRSYLFYGSFSRIPIPLPPKIKEQQKIADCLSSLDELITAQSLKIDTLKTHKKGLMQGLFPFSEGIISNGDTESTEGNS